MNEDITDRIIELMHKKGFNKMDLARAFGSSGSSSNLTQKGSRLTKSRNLDELQKIAEILEIPLESLIFDQSQNTIENTGAHSQNIIGDDVVIGNAGDPDLDRVLKIKDDEERKLALQYLARKG